MRWWKANKWFIQVHAAFKNVKSDPKLGKDIAVRFLALFLLLFHSPRRKGANSCVGSGPSLPPFSRTRCAT